MRTNWKNSVGPIGPICLLSACLWSSSANAGTLEGSQASAPATVNLTAEGTLDWAHWGLFTETDFDQKAGGASQISNFTQITGSEANNVFQFADAAVAFSWSDGTPNASAVLTPSGIFVGGLTNGYQFTVGADTTQKVLKVYAGAWNAQVQFEATLSDGSAAAYVNDDLDDFGAGEASVYTIRFAADSPGQMLTVRIYSIALNDPDGNCTLMGATLGVPATGTLSGMGTFLPSGAAANLTSEGKLDWAHWGLATETDFNHKSGVTQQITGFSLIGSGFVAQTGSSPAAYYWSDGTPTQTSSNTSGIWVGGEGNGFEFTARPIQARSCYAFTPAPFQPGCISKRS